MPLVVDDDRVALTRFADRVGVAAGEECRERPARVVVERDRDAVAGTLTTRVAHLAVVGVVRHGARAFAIVVVEAHELRSGDRRRRDRRRCARRASSASRPTRCRGRGARLRRALLDATRSRGRQAKELRSPQRDPASSWRSKRNPAGAGADAGEAGWPALRAPFPSSPPPQAPSPTAESNNTQHDQNFFVRVFHRRSSCLNNVETRRTLQWVIALPKNRLVNQPINAIDAYQPVDLPRLFRAVPASSCAPCRALHLPDPRRTYTSFARRSIAPARTAEPRRAPSSRVPDKRWHNHAGWWRSPSSRRDSAKLHVGARVARTRVGGPRGLGAFWRLTGRHGCGTRRSGRRRCRVVRGRR